MISVMWADSAETIIRLDYVNPVNNWEEYHTAVDQSHEMALSKSYPIVIIHNPGDTTMPSGNGLEHIMRVLRKVPSNVTTVYMVISNPFARRILEIALRIFASSGTSFEYYFMPSIERCYQHMGK